MDEAGVRVMSAYTKVGTTLWTWRPFVELEHSHDDLVGRCSKYFWIALYTAREAKLVPGLFQGSITTMAESASIPVDDARRYLDRLLEHDLVEIDLRSRLLRLTQLPDPGESPANGKAIRGWWNRFQTMPGCEVRDAHVEVLYWIIHEWSRVNGKRISEDHSQAWSETFGRIPMPKRKAKRPTYVQTELFNPPKREINYLDTNTHTNTCWSRNQQDPDTDQDQDQDPRSPEEGGSGGGAPRLRLLPPPPHPQIDALLALLTAVAGGSWQATGAHERAFLEDQFERLPTVDFALLGQWMRSQGGSAAMTVARELVNQPGRLIAAVQEAQRWADNEAQNKDKAARMSEELRKELEAAGLRM